MNFKWHFVIDLFVYTTKIIKVNSLKIFHGDMLNKDLLKKEVMIRFIPQ